jgi:hypothetical protein
MEFYILNLITLTDNNDRVYILDQQKHKWIVKGRFRDALAFQDSVVHLWQKTEFGPTLTMFLVSSIILFILSALLIYTRNLILRWLQLFPRLSSPIAPVLCQSLVLGRLVLLPCLLLFAIHC